MFLSLCIVNIGKYIYNNWIINITYNELEKHFYVVDMLMHSLNLSSQGRTCYPAAEGVVGSCFSPASSFSPAGSAAENYLVQRHIPGNPQQVSNPVEVQLSDHFNPS